MKTLSSSLLRLPFPPADGLPAEAVLIRSDRKTLAVQVKSDGSLVIRAPRRMHADEISRFVVSKKSWIRAQLEKQLARGNQTAPALTDAELDRLYRLAAEILPLRVRYFAPLVGTDWGRITIRCQKTRWGSCSSAGNLNFNCLLMLAPAEVRDYVVVHELCHRLEMNHSARFWAEVARVCPDHRVQRKWLRENGPALMKRAFG